MTIAAVGATVMLMLGGGLFFTAKQAKSEVDATQESYRLVAAYTRLVYQASLLEEQSWGAVNDSETGAPVKLSSDARSSRARFRELLQETTRLASAAGPERARANAGVRRRAVAVIATADRFDVIASNLQTLTREQGIGAATAYADQVLQPFNDFDRAVKAEVDVGDAAISQATLRAARLTRATIFAASASLGLGLLLMIAQSRLIFGRLSRGLDRLERGVRAFGQGDLQQRIRLGGRDELARLSDAFDGMAQELADKQQALEAAKSGLEAAVAERTRELEAANAALAAEDERRRRFLADVGHELRTPLTIIRGEAQVALRADARGAGEPAVVFGRILEQTQGMGRLVDDLFLIARAEAGGLPLMCQRFDLADLAVRVAADFEALAAEGGARITAAAGPPIWVDADPDRIRQAVAALVDNALRHAGPSARIELSTAFEGREAVLAVSDDGPGVPGEDAGELFGRFRRGESRGDGSGLGLSVVRALAEAHGGSARLANRPGGGARAEIRLPAASPMLEAAE